MYEIDIFSKDGNGNIVVTVIVGDPEVDDSKQNKIIKKYVDSLPDISEFERVRKDVAIFTDWDDYAKKGIIAYDDYDGENILTSRPLTPLNIKDLPIRIQNQF
jgi:hypothetical protein